MRSPFNLRSGVSVWHELLGGTAVYVLFIPSGFDSLITSDGNTFKVREA